jgi:hypothetical protein
LNDFTEEEAGPLALGMRGKTQSGSQLLRRVLYGRPSLPDAAPLPRRGGRCQRPNCYRSRSHL